MDKRACRLCGVAKDTSDFEVKRNGDLHSCCRPCAERRREYKRRWTERNPNYHRDGSRLRYKTVAGRASTLLGASRQNAKKKGIENTLERDWIIERLEGGVCEVTGLALSFDEPEEGKRRNPRAPSLDRIDPEKGYTPENTVLVCWQYNAAKSEYGKEALDELVEALHRTGQSAAKPREGNVQRPSREGVGPSGPKCAAPH